MADRAGEATRSAGLRRLRDFTASAGAHYSRSRNFDFGPERRGNVSLLSAWIRHRLILEQEVLQSTLEQHSLERAGKFVDEVFWRGYFKGWLEHRPAVWSDYRRSVSQQLQALENDSELLKRYESAIEGRTGIECFDTWVEELVRDGYLHNHARMWFASIWVYTLRLPWQLGADFFYRHLVDGDPASNTLSWRWVCGLHTRGKTYLARASNIRDFSNNRFNPEGQLALQAPALTETAVHPIGPLRTPQVLRPGEKFGLLITEEDCFAESLFEEHSPVAILGVLATSYRSPLPVGAPASRFATEALSDALARAARALGADGELSASDNWGDLLLDWASRHRLKTIATAHAPVGPVADLLNEASAKLDRHGVKLLQLRRPYDSATWPHARSGFFKLKKQIPSILNRLAIHSVDNVGSKAV